MDAIYYQDPLAQYSIENMSREVFKAYTCFRIPKSLQQSMFGIATGNWGCGAFNGDRHVKGTNRSSLICVLLHLFPLAIIQLMAASEAGRPLIYITFRHRTLAESFWEVYKYLTNQQATVRDLCAYLQQYSTRYDQSTLFEFILKTPIRQSITNK